MAQYDLATMREELLAGNNRCLERIFAEEADFCIKNLQKSTSCSQEDAEDVFVESVMNMREKIISGKMNFLSSVRNYLYTTCRNMWANRLQRANKLNDKIDDMARFFYEEYQNDFISQVEAVENQESRLAIVKNAFSQLTGQCRDVLHYFYVENLSMKEIAELTKLSDANVVKVIKHRCLKKLINLVSLLLEEKKDE